MNASRPDNEAIFHAARDVPEPDRRREYVREACGGDEARIAQVEALLVAADRPDSLLDRPAAGIPVATIDHAAADGPRTVIGPYKLLEQIGEGGMGSVWMAQQTEPVKRLVAVKLIKAGMDSKQVIARFEAERQALALMDHPNIARVLDGGTSSAGRPYFVMDLVKGASITRYCDEHHLAPRQRLELFIPVCQAVQHAHQKGIIHRDLKPSNVLVARSDGKPVPKVIDFGVAKAAGQSLTDKTLVTGFGAVVGTLEYMSPEQAELNQLDIDTRSDVYALGILLYELLTGTTPLEKKRLRGASMLEALRLIREEEPPRPSTRLSTTAEMPAIAANRGLEPKRLTKLVRGDLDWIVMKTLEKDRNRRYETANGFAQDVQRYLAGEPVLAAPASPWYRLRKLARRNKGGLAVAALVLFFLVLLGSGAGWAVRDRSAREAEAVRQQGERQARVAGQVEPILAEVDRLEKEQKWPQALEAARRAEAAVAGGEADPATAERSHQRLRELEFIDRLEQIRTPQIEGLFDYAQRDRHYARAFREHGVDVDALPVEMAIARLKARPALAVALAATLDDWVLVRRHLSETEVARWQRLVAVARGIDPGSLRDRIRASWGQPVVKVSDELRRLAESIDVRAQHPTTLVILGRTLQRVGQPGPALRLLRDAQYAHPGDFWLNLELTNVLHSQQDHEGAVRFATAAVASRPQSAGAHINLGSALHDQKKVDEVLACAHKAIELGPKLAIAYYNLGKVLRDQNKLDEAITAYRKAIKLGPKYARAYVNLGNALYAQKKLPEAVAAYNKAIELDPKYALAHYNLGNALRDQKKLPEAIAAYTKAIEFDPKFTLAHYNLGLTLSDQKKLPEAIAAYTKAIELGPKNADGYNGLGNALRKQKKLPEAIDAFRKAIELRPKDAMPHYNLGLTLLDQRKVPAAIAAFNKAITIDPNYALAYEQLGVLSAASRDYGKALEYARKVVEIEPKNAKAHNNLGGVLHHQGKLDQAIACYRKAIELTPKYALAYYNLGKTLLMQKNLPEAITAYNKAIELGPKYANAYTGLGNALLMQKKLPEAIAAYNKAIELGPKNAYAYNNLGNALLNQKKLPEAITAHRKAIERDPKNAYAYTGIGLALFSQGKRDEAIRCFRKAIELAPNYPAARNALAYTLSISAWVMATHAEPARRDPRRALSLAREAVELAPQSFVAWQVLGWAHYRSGDWKASIKALEKSCALQASPKGGDAAQGFFLAMAHWQVGQKAKARELYDRAVQWMDKNQPKNEELRRFRAEAAQLLELKEKK